MVEVTRTLRVYSMHARVGEQIIDYRRFFAELARMGSAESVTEVARGLSFALEGARLVDGHFFARVVSGSPDEVPTYFDYRSGRLADGATPPGKWLARVARIVVDPNPDRRSLVLEAARSGVSVALLERYFGLLADPEVGPSARFDLTPVPSPSVLREIENLERIREVAITAVRPNFDWVDMTNGLAELAAESGGAEADAVIRAPRGESLQKNAGAVKVVTDSVARDNPNVSEFRVVGRPRGADKDVTVSSRRHQLQGYVRIDTADPLERSDVAIIEEAIDLIGDVGGRSSLE